MEKNPKEKPLPEIEKMAPEIPVPDSLTPMVPQWQASPERSWVETIWSIVRMLAEEAVVLVEIMIGPGKGAEKKRKAERLILEWLEKLEEELDLIPDWIQTVAFLVIRRALGTIIEGALHRVKSRGEI